MSEDKQELANLDDLPLDKYGDDAFDATASSTAFLPRIQLMTASAKLCKAGKFAINHYALVRDQKFDDLGENLDILLITWRPKALDTGENIISDYTPGSTEFERIKDRADNVKDSGCMYGPEFLCWVPSIEKIATFFMGTKSARRESAAVKALLKQPATLGNQFCKNKYHEWYAPQVSKCSTPFQMPAKDVLVAAIEKFNNPPKPEMEGVEEEAETRAR